MLRRLAALALILSVAGPALAQAPARPAAKAAPAAKAPPAPPFNPQDPQSLIVLLGQLGAQASVARRSEDSVFLQVTTPAYGFTAQFAGCNAQGRACKALAFTTVSEQRAASLPQVNAFNQTSLTCRAWQDKAGKPHVMYTALVSPADSRGEIQTHLGAWQGCLAEFGDFLKDPAAYLASAP